MRVFLVRHGQTAWNSLGHIQGHTDVPLDEIGLMQARAVGAELRATRIGRVISSDLARAADTARIIGESVGAVPETTSLLRERRFGDWEGKNYAEIAERFRTLAKTDGVDTNEVCAPGGGESYRNVWDRLDPIVAELFDSHHSVVVVSHGGTCGILMARLLDANLESHRAFRHSNGAISEFERRPDGHLRLVRYNDSTHIARYESLMGETSAIGA